MATLKSKINIWGLLAAALLGATLAFIPLVDASFLPLPESDELDVAKPEGDTAVQRAENFLGPLARIIRIIMAVIAVVMIVIAGFSMVIRAENEETAKTQKTAMTYGVLGLILISLAGPVAAIFDFRAGNFLADPESLAQRAQLFDNTTHIVVTFIKYLLGSLATLFMIRSGFMMVTSQGAEETITREKKNLGLGAGGLLMVVVADLIVRELLYNTSYNAETGTTVAIDQNEIINQLVGFTNIMVSFVGPALMLLMVVGGVLYITAGGEEERMNMAKKMMVNSVIGIAIIYGSFAIVSTVIAGVF